MLKICTNTVFAQQLRCQKFVFIYINWDENLNSSSTLNPLSLISGGIEFYIELTMKMSCKATLELVMDVLIITYHDIISV